MTEPEAETPSDQPQGTTATTDQTRVTPPPQPTPATPPAAPAQVLPAPQAAPPTGFAPPTEVAPPAASQPEEKKPKFRAAYVFIFFDYVCRWLLYGLWRYEVLPGWAFWLGQLVFIPLVAFILAVMRYTIIRAKHNFKQDELLAVEPTLFSWVVTIGGIVAGTYISYILYPGWPTWARVLLAVATFFVYGIYVIMISFGSPQTRPKDFETQTQIELPLDEWVDENDREIIRLETDKISMSQRVDTYTLESTLFGALSFSGFVTIIASEKDVLAGVQEMVADFSEIARMISLFDFAGYERPLTGLATEEALLAAIAVETLICAMFFLSVVVSRLRFNDALKRVDLAVRLAVSYNSKEEEVYNLTLQAQNEEQAAAIGERLEILKVKITNAVYHAEEAFADLKPIVNYMWVSRNFGLFSFLLILITGAVWVSPLLAVVFAGLSVLAYVYARVEHWVRTNNLKKRGIFNFFNRRAIFKHVRHGRE